MTPFRVLVVDDNPDHRFLTRRAIQSMRDELPVEVEAAEDGEAALARLSGPSPPPDVVLLDVKMPGIDGFEVLRRLRAQEATRGLAVVVFSSSENGADVERARLLGASGFVTKPLEARAFADVVRETVRAWAAARRGGDAGQPGAP